MPAVRRAIRTLDAALGLREYFYHPILGTVLPAVTTAYFLCLDVFGGDWRWINDFKHIHSAVFSGLVGITLATVFLKGLVDWAHHGRSRDYAELLEGLLAAVNNIMTAKKARFHNRIAGLRPRSNVFNTITHPRDQIEEILRESQRFFSDSLRINKSEFDITVMMATGRSSGKFVAKANKEWVRTKPSTLLSSKSTVKWCLGTGEYVFFPSKAIAEREGKYHRSTRDKARGDGSIYCQPLTVTVAEKEYKYVVTFSTYGRLMCDATQEESIEAIRVFCSEFVKRIEIELTLLAIKSWVKESN